MPGSIPVPSCSEPLVLHETRDVETAGDALLAQHADGGLGGGQAEHPRARPLDAGDVLGPDPGELGDRVGLAGPGRADHQVHRTAGGQHPRDRAALRRTQRRRGQLRLDRVQRQSRVAGHGRGLDQPCLPSQGGGVGVAVVGGRGLVPAATVRAAPRLGCLVQRRHGDPRGVRVRQRGAGERVEQALLVRGSELGEHARGQVRVQRRRHIRAGPDTEPPPDIGQGLLDHQLLLSRREHLVEPLTRAGPAQARLNRLDLRRTRHTRRLNRTRLNRLERAHRGRGRHPDELAAELVTDLRLPHREQLRPGRRVRRLTVARQQRRLGVELTHLELGRLPLVLRPVRIRDLLSPRLDRPPPRGEHLDQSLVDAGDLPALAVRPRHERQPEPLSRQGLTGAGRDRRRLGAHLHDRGPIEGIPAALHVPGRVGLDPHPVQQRPVHVQLRVPVAGGVVAPQVRHELARLLPPPGRAPGQLPGVPPDPGVAGLLHRRRQPDLVALLDALPQHVRLAVQPGRAQPCVEHRPRLGGGEGQVVVVTRLPLLRPRRERQLTQALLAQRAVDRRLLRRHRLLEPLLRGGVAPRPRPQRLTRQRVAQIPVDRLHRVRGDLVALGEQDEIPGPAEPVDPGAEPPAGGLAALCGGHVVVPDIRGPLDMVMVETVRPTPVQASLTGLLRMGQQVPPVAARDEPQVPHGAKLPPRSSTMHGVRAEF